MKKDNLTYDLLSAIIADDEERVSLLLDEGANPNHCLDKANVTPLHYAAQHNAIKAIGLLLHAGADIHAKTHPDNQTATEIASLHNYRQAVQLLTYYSQRTDKPLTEN